MRFNILQRVVISALCLGYLATAPMLAHAQETDSDGRWQFNAALYLWGAGIDGTTRTGNKFDVGLGDIIDNLDLAFMGAFEAHRSKWSLGADVIYLDVSAEKAGTIGASSIPDNANVDLTGGILDFRGTRNVLDVERATVEILAGARYLDVDSKLTLRLGASGPTPTATQSASVWDGVIGVKGNLNITKKWYLPYYLDVGTGQSDFTWQGTGGVGYRFNWGNVVLVYRHMHWDFGSDSLLKDISFGGPALGTVFKF